MMGSLADGIREHFSKLRHEAMVDHQYERISDLLLIQRLNSLKQMEKSVMSVMNGSEDKYV